MCNTLSSLGLCIYLYSFSRLKQHSFSRLKHHSTFQFESNCSKKIKFKTKLQTFRKRSTTGEKSEEGD